MTSREIKSLMVAAGTTVNKLDRKLGRVEWAALTDAERAAWLAFQRYRIEHDTLPSWGVGRLVRTGDGAPLAWWDIDTRIKGGQKYPEWTAV